MNWIAFENERTREDVNVHKFNYHIDDSYMIVNLEIESRVKTSGIDFLKNSIVDAETTISIHQDNSESKKFRISKTVADVSVYNSFGVLFGSLVLIFKVEPIHLE